MKPPEGTYELTPEQTALFLEPARNEILTLLAERPASIKELSEALGKPRGSVGHHVKVLHEGGLIEVVGTRQVRAITEKYYGRKARTFLFPHGYMEDNQYPFVGEAVAEMRPEHEGETTFMTLRHARIPLDDAELFGMRLLEISEEFTDHARGGETTYGLFLAMYPTDRPSLPEFDDQEDDG
jgi:DNA-binding transcriptional ArsR family regulator